MALALPIRDATFLNVSQSSLAHRARVSKLLHPLRRTTPRVPFYEIAAHRIPTLWTLYRGLLKETQEYEQIRWRVGSLVRLHRHQTSPSKVVSELQTGYRWLEYFRLANAGDQRRRHVLERYSSIIAAQRTKARIAAKLMKEMEWQKQAKIRPRLTGSWIKPTLFNPILPRMRPQPARLSMIFHRRRKSRLVKMARWPVMAEMQKYVDSERLFEKQLDESSREQGLEKVEKFFRHPGWVVPIHRWFDAHQQTMQLEQDRLASQPTQEMQEAVQQARRLKIAHKTQIAMRERRGEIFRSTLRKRARGLPAHMIPLVGEKGVDIDRVLKDPSEGGYSGEVKRRHGLKLKGDWLSTGMEENIVTSKSIKLVESIRLEAARRAGIA